MNVSTTEMMDVEPHQERQRRLEIPLSLTRASFGDGGVDEMRAALTTTIMMRIMKIHTSNCLNAQLATASTMNEIGATPVTPPWSRSRRALGPTGGHSHVSLSPITPGLRASSSLTLNTIFISPDRRWLMHHRQQRISADQAHGGEQHRMIATLPTLVFEHAEVERDHGADEHFRPGIDLPA